MRLSWGYKIAIAYLAFVAGILFLVYKANNEKFDLVTREYYEEELKYQNVIDQQARVAELSALPVITHAVQSIDIRFPEEFHGKKLQGEIFLYRPSDAKKDWKQAFAINGTAFHLDLPGPLSGMYDVKLSWTADGRTYYHERKIFF